MAENLHLEIEYAKRMNNKRKGISELGGLLKVSHNLNSHPFIVFSFVVMMEKGLYVDVSWSLLSNRDATWHKNVSDTYIIVNGQET